MKTVSTTSITFPPTNKRWLPELIVDWLPGYEKSAPVRVGNAAYQQVQLDVFGEIADALFQALKAGRAIADEIHAEVCERGFDRELGSFVQAYSSKCLDASLLLIPLVGFLPADDSRVRGTLRAIEDRLLVGGEFVVRYESEHAGDGLPPGEGAFLACSFWLVDNYILQGRRAEACKLFDRLLARCNDVGLLAEELDMLTGRMLGNFPQAYSQVGLINSALNLSRKTGPVVERAEQPAPMATAEPR